MPDQTTLEALQEIEEHLKRPEVHSNVAVYAIGLLNRYQSKHHESIQERKKALLAQLALLERPNDEHQKCLDELDLLERQAGLLGFYYTIFLLHKLPIEQRIISVMIQAILSLDTTGIYLSAREQIVILEEVRLAKDGIERNIVPFILGDVLRQYGLDVSPLDIAAKQYQKNAEPLHSPTISRPTNFDSLSDETKKQWMCLLRQAEDASDVDLLTSKIRELPLAFDLLSLKPKQFLWVLAQMFALAKERDRVRLFTLNTDLLPEDKPSAGSDVAFLDNSLHIWFVLSLVQAVNIKMFNERLEFLVNVLALANEKKPILPPYATADIYIPLVLFANVLKQSILQFHPAVQSHRSVVDKMCLLFRAPESIAEYANARALSTGRMSLTRKLVHASDKAGLCENSPEADAAKLIFDGQQICDYFSSKLSDEIVISPHVHALSKALEPVNALFHNKDNFVVQELVAGVYPLHQQYTNPGRQLRALTAGLHFVPTHVFFRKTSTAALRSRAGTTALEYIATQAARIAETHWSSDDNYNTQVKKWCSTITTTVTKIESLDPKSPRISRSLESIPATPRANFFLGFFRRRRAQSNPEIPSSKPSDDVNPDEVRGSKSFGSSDV